MGKKYKKTSYYIYRTKNSFHVYTNLKSLYADNMHGRELKYEKIYL